MQEHRHLRGILFGRPPGVAAAAEVFRAAGVADRCQVVAGDFFQGVPEDADAFSWPTCCTTGTTRIRCGSWLPAAGAMAVDGRVPIVERLILHNPADAVPVLLSDLNMLILAGGQEPTLSLPNTASSWPRLA